MGQSTVDFFSLRKMHLPADGYHQLELNPTIAGLHLGVIASV
jgi:hypothetical protein